MGTFDRPNLTYRILPKVDQEKQIIEVLRRHPREAGIVYCLSRKDTVWLAETLRGAGIRAEHYHAGMAADQRRATQERFAAEQTDVIVATIAFGMGIDRSNVRAVIHACLPKSIENYQQETGRAGRDGLAAECVLLYSQADVMRLERVIKKSAEEAEDAEAAARHLAVQLGLLRRMRGFAQATDCRHKALSEYFGQGYAEANCRACDTCLGEVEDVGDSTVTAQKILSCVARVQERFGVGHVVEVLVGAQTERIQKLRHDKLSTYGLLRDVPRKTVQSYTYQLLDQGLLARSDGEMPVLQLNPASWEVLKGSRKVRLVQPKKKERIQREKKKGKAGRGEAVSAERWEGVDDGLFEHLRQVRRQIAVEQDVPAYVVLHDRTLIELARVRPMSVAELLGVHGMGQRKVAAYGERLVEEIMGYCREHGLTRGVAAGAGAADPAEAARRPAVTDRAKTAAEAGTIRRLAESLFAQALPIETIMQLTGLRRSEVLAHLAAWEARRG